MEDNEAVAAVVAGNKDAFEHVVRRYHRRLFYFVAGKVAGEAEAEDIVQKSFVTAYHSLRQYDAARPFIGWLRGIALNHCRNEWRHYERQCRMKGNLLEAKRAELEADFLEKPEAHDERHVLALRECLKGLPEEQRKIIDLRYVQELSLKELGETLDKNSEAVRLLLFRIRTRLGTCVKRRISSQEQPA